jgi:tetratricopeptide (TPR) repeat protein
MSTESAAPDAGSHAAVRVLLRQAEQSFERAEHSAAITLAEQAVALARDSNDLPHSGRGLLLLGKVQTYLGQPAQGYASASEAYELLGACGDVERQLRALSTCAGVLYMCGDPNRAIDLVRKGLAASAHRPDCSEVRATMLMNLAISLCQDATEYEEAIRCSADAVALAAQAFGTLGLQICVVTQLAYAHVRYADRLGDQGRHGEAALQFEAAAGALPLLDPRSWQTFSHFELLALPFQAQVLAALGRWPMARRAVAAMLWSMRVPGSRNAGQINRLESLAHFYRRAGLIRQSIRYEAELLAVCEVIGNHAEAGRCLQRLAQLHAQTGAFDLALACHKQLAAVRGLLRLETSTLRCRLATIELAQLPASDATPTLIRARIEAGEAATVVLHIEAWAHAALATAGETSAALGIALGKEIAAEMGGSLQTVRDDDTALHYRLHYRLQLPEAGARVRERPGGTEMTPPSSLSLAAPRGGAQYLRNGRAVLR